MSSVEDRARELLAPIEVAINKLREEMGWYANAYADPAAESVEAIAAALREQPEARGVVDDAMVERAMAAREPFSRTRVVEHFFSRGRIPMPEWDEGRLVVRAILTAALTGERNG